MVDTSAYLLELADLAAPVELAALFGADRPVELEVGPGKGLFLASAAARNAGHSFLGIELSRKYAQRSAERVAKQGLGNVRVLHGDARLLLARYLVPASLRAVHVYFPDPWWKKRHKKRRVFTETLVADVARALEPRGELWLATDVEDYFGMMQAIVAKSGAYQPRAFPEPQEPTHDLDYLTNFERKYRIEGRSIYRARYQLAGPPSSPGEFA